MGFENFSGLPQMEVPHGHLPSRENKSRPLPYVEKSRPLPPKKERLELGEYVSALSRSKWDQLEKAMLPGLDIGHCVELYIGDKNVLADIFEEYIESTDPSESAKLAQKLAGELSS